VAQAPARELPRELTAEFYNSLTKNHMMRV